MSDPTALLSDHQLMSLNEVGTLLSISRRTIYRLVADGELPTPIKLGSKSMFVATEIVKYVDRLKARRSS